ncbi:MAG TPA: hypothetical protein P5026_13525 [Kiritimatiellia bacterium]|nr:hypothetical protein [Kiritimatiellia bacterium]HRU71734.1 hypothetical protein [Kiritimatiellia bacterium]
MIRLIKNLHRALKRRRHYRGGEARLAQVLPELAAVCGGPVSVQRGRGGGHDYVYFVEREGRPVGVLRIANPAYIPDGTPREARRNGPRLRLTPRERVAREWRLCEAGWRHALTPRPLWRTEEGDAMLNSYLAGSRLFDCVRAGRLSFWDAIERTAERAGLFHKLVGEPHMDLSLLNVYADARLDVLTLIDFELSPAPVLSAEEARLFDYLNLIEMAYKEMPAIERCAAPERLERLFASCVPRGLHGLPVARLAPKLPRLLADATFRAALARHLTV